MAEQKNMVTINIPISRNNEGDVLVGLNGKTWLIKRGEDVKVPLGVAKIIRRSEKALAQAIAYEKKAQENFKGI
jgi:hypothetical protein